jgi:hypothetical protein
MLKIQFLKAWALPLDPAGNLCGPLTFYFFILTNFRSVFCLKIIKIDFELK